MNHGLILYCVCSVTRAKYRKVNTITLTSYFATTRHCNRFLNHFLIITPNIIMVLLFSKLNAHLIFAALASRDKRFQRKREDGQINVPSAKECAFLQLPFVSVCRTHLQQGMFGGVFTLRLTRRLPLAVNLGFQAVWRNDLTRHAVVSWSLAFGT